MADQIQVFPGVIEHADRDSVKRHVASVRHPAMKGAPVPVEGALLPNDKFTRKRIAEGGLSLQKLDYEGCVNFDAPIVPVSSEPVTQLAAVVQALTEPTHEALAKAASGKQRRGESPHGSSE